MTCGGCNNLGSHKRWCPAVVGPRAALLGATAEQVDSCADMVGGSDPGLANRCYTLGNLLRGKADECAAEHRGAG